MSRFISDDEQEALDHAQRQLNREAADHRRLRRFAVGLFLATVATLVVIAAALFGAYMGGRP